MQRAILDEIHHPGNSVTGWRPQKAGVLSSPWGNKIIEELLVCELIGSSKRESGQEMTVLTSLSRNSEQSGT